MTRSFIGLSALLALCGSAFAFDTFDYANYPISATTLANQTCQASDVKSISFTVDGVRFSDLEDAQLSPGSVINWVYGTYSAACEKQPVALALYASDGNPIGALALSSNQTLVASSVNTLYSGNKSITLTVPKSFCGPYQLDAVFGQPLPRVGYSASFYNGMYRVGHLATSDGRSMLVSSKVGDLTGQATGGTCSGGGAFPDLAANAFDYAGYPANVLTVDRARCPIQSIVDDEAGLGFYLNGLYVGNPGVNTGKGSPNLVLRAGDTVQYRFITRTLACSGQLFSLSLYRNPAGAAGVYMDKPLKLASVATAPIIGGAINTLALTVPSYFRGGWQINTAFGAALPIVGDIGARYRGADFDLLKTSAAGFISR